MLKQRHVPVALPGQGEVAEAFLEGSARAFDAAVARSWNSASRNSPASPAGSSQPPADGRLLAGLLHGFRFAHMVRLQRIRLPVGKALTFLRLEFASYEVLNCAKVLLLVV